MRMDAADEVPIIASMILRLNSWVRRTLIKSVRPDREPVELSKGDPGNALMLQGRPSMVRQAHHERTT
jgi:hypothetical protein